MNDMVKKIYFLPNGTTVVFDGETQMPELQMPWVELFAEFLETKVQSTTHWDLHFPDGRTGYIWRTDENGSWDWRFLSRFDKGYKEPADLREEILLIAGFCMGLSTSPYVALDKDERKRLLRAGELLLAHSGLTNSLSESNTEWRHTARERLSGRRQNPLPVTCGEVPRALS